MQSYRLELTEEAGQKLAKTLKKLRDGEIDRSMNHAFVCVTGLLNAEGTQAWRWQNYYLVYNAAQDGYAESHELHIEANMPPQKLPELKWMDARHHSRVPKKRQQSRALQQAINARLETAREESANQDNTPQQGGGAQVTYLKSAHKKPVARVYDLTDEE